IHQSVGLEVEVLSGEQEADLVFRGVTTDPILANQPLLVLDVGGGSTEFIFGEGANQYFRESFPVGTVRLLERFPPSDPPSGSELSACLDWLKESMARKVKASLEPLFKHRSGGVVRLVGTGGTTAIMSKIESRLETFDREKI